MAQDIVFIFHWYLQLFLLGLIFLPTTFLIFRNFKDQGYGFSKITATLFTTYFVFFLATAKILPFIKSTIIIVLFISILINLFLIRKVEIAKIIKGNWKLFIFEELLFIFCFVFWAFIKSYEPSIQTLEKFMDFGFINSTLRSNYLPAQDMWFAGSSINYYYFGHFIVAFLTKLSEIPSYLTYNLMLITIFSYKITFTFSIAIKIKKLLGTILYYQLTTNLPIEKLGKNLEKYPLLSNGRWKRGGSWDARGGRGGTDGGTNRWTRRRSSHLL